MKRGASEGIKQDRNVETVENVHESKAVVEHVISIILRCTNTAKKLFYIFKSIT